MNKSLEADLFVVRANVFDMVDKKEELAAIIDRIKERFLQPDIKGEKFDSIEEILAKPVFLLKNVDKVTSLALDEIFKVKTIQDLANLDAEDPYEALVPKNIKKPEVRWNRKKELMEKIQTQLKSLNFDLPESIVIAQMINRSWQKRQIYSEEAKKEKKIICMGLDNAGKTALLSLIGGKSNFAELAKLQPTRGVDYKNYSSRNYKLIVLDMGGQVDYRRRYFQEPEKYFVGLSALLYVIDMKDSARYPESLDYFKQIIQNLQNLGEKPQILIFLHKSDPDLVKDPDYKINQEFIRGEFFKVLEPEGKKALFEFEMFPTSIYNFSTEAGFATSVKDLLNVQSLNDPMLRRVEGLGEILDKLTNTMMTLTSQMLDQINNISQQVSALNGRVYNLEQATPASSATASGAAPGKGSAKPGATPPPGVVVPPPPPGIGRPPPAPGAGNVKARAQASDQSLRQNIMEELRTIFARRKQMDGD